MSFKIRSLVTIDDFSVNEIEALFTLSDSMAANMADQLELCRGKVMASLFFEPSTRTRLSFETAMHRLGGSVVSAMDIGATSLAKGESIADMARVIGSYADIIVIRHPWEGAAKVIADYSGVPVINAGDGGHQHPTQTLLDLYTIRKERGAINGLNIALWGDLKYGRTIHSLIFALAKFGANILFCPSPGLGVPEHVMQKLIAEYGGEVEKVSQKPSKEGNRFQLNAIYTTPNHPHQLAMMPGVDFELELKAGVDAIYVTRPQKERFTSDEKGLNASYPVVNKAMLTGRSFNKTIVMHPLPRVDELAYELDSDPRSQYFKQAAQGVPVRMALIASLLGAVDLNFSVENNPTEQKYPVYKRETGIKCTNSKCVSIQETELRYLKPEYKIVGLKPLTLRCVYCEHGFEPKYVASTEWHEGMSETKKFHSASSHWTSHIKPENLLLFNTVEDAEASGFKPSRFVKGETQNAV
jgi:aspartate carbamoyltransferase catalytic subunit